MSDSGISSRKRLQGLSLALALPLMGAGVSAQTSRSDPTARSDAGDGGMNVESLADMTRLPDLPAGAEISLDRITYPPGVMLSLPAAGPVAYVVERGTLDVRIPDDIPGQVVLSGGRDRFAMARNGFTRVLTGGSVYAPAGGLEVTRNPGTMPTVALVVRVTPDPNAGAAVVTAAATGEPHGASRRRRGRDRATAVPADRQASVEPLADLPFAPGLEPEVRASLVRIVYPPGATFDLGAYAGPTLISVEQGVVDLRYEPGHPPGVGFANAGRRPLTTPDGFVRLPSGASVSARDGRLGMTRNASDAPGSLLAVLLELDGDAGDASGSSVVAGRREAHRRHRRDAQNGDMPSATISPGSVVGPPWTDLTETGPLPAIPAGATAALRRIVIAPDETIDITYLGPTLYYVVHGTLGVEPDRPLRFVRLDGAPGRGGMPIGRNGEVPAGIGVYAVDGDLGPTRNAGDDDLVILALLIVPQPSGGAIEQASGGATAVATPVAASEAPRRKRRRDQGTPEAAN